MSVLEKFEIELKSIISKYCFNAPTSELLNNFETEFEKTISFQQQEQENSNDHVLKDLLNDIVIDTFRMVLFQRFVCN